MNAETTSVLSYGLGPIGLKILENCLSSESVSVIGAVDIDPEKIGKDIGYLTGKSEKGLSVVRTVDEVSIPSLVKRPIALHATGSNAAQVWPQLRQLIDAGYSIVSTCEQLSYPWHRYPELSSEIDSYAKEKGQFVIGTGINPGFVMDALTVFASSVTQTINSIYVSRKVDVSKRRVPLQKKVGIGMTAQQFQQLADENKIGHVGLEESLRLIAYGLNLPLEDVQNTIEPTIAQENTELALGPLVTGQVSGLHQVSKGTGAGRIPVVLDLTMSVGVEQEDRIILKTEELGQVELVVPNGIFGDTATANVLINTAKTLHQTEATGLLTMVDIKAIRNVANTCKVRK